MLTRKTPETLAVDITLKAQGVTGTIACTFYNKTQDELDAVMKDAAEDQAALIDPTFVVRQALLSVLKDWSAEFEVSGPGLREAEMKWPGVTVALFRSYHKLREVEIVKN